MPNYKGFDKDLRCRGFQYEIDKEYEEPKAIACKEGFHACENPLDVFTYYPPAGNRFCEVEQYGELSKNGEDSKVASTKIKIGAELTIAGMVKAAINYTKEKAESATSGDWANAATSGDWANAATSGYWANAATSGDCANAATSGYCANAIVSGNESKAEVKRAGSIAAAFGNNCIVKSGEVGTAIALCERGKWNGKYYPILSIKAVIVDGEIIKPDTWYTIKNGDIVEEGDTE